MMVIAAAVAMSSIPQALAEDPEPAGRHARVTLEAAAPPVAGTETLVGVTFALDDGWHIYWHGRNDSGTHPEIEWTVEPSTAKIGPVRWPAPERHVAPGDILDHVYFGSVSLIVPVRLPQNATGVLRLTAKVNYLICKDICVPESASTTLELPIVAPSDTPGTAGPKAAPSASPALRASLDRLPKPAPTDAYRVSWTDDSVIVRVDKAAALQFYPLASCVELENLIQDGVSTSNSLTLRLPTRTIGASAEEQPVLAGILEARHADGRTEWYEVQSARPASSPAPKKSE